MRCARCGRMLLRPGVPGPIAGGQVITGPKCAEMMLLGELGRPRRARTATAGPRRRRAAGQGDLFGAVA